MGIKYGIAFYSGGKDSHYAIIKALMDGIVVKYILTVNPQRIDSWMFHAVNTKWVKLHSRAMSLPIIELRVSGLKEIELNELRSQIKDYIDMLKHSNIEYLVSGAVASRYQKERLDALAEELELKHYTPLWGLNPLKVLNEELDTLSFIFVAIQAYGLNPSLLGKVVSKDDLTLMEKYYKDLGVNPIGEGGEFETFVIKSPLFRGKGISIRKAELVWNPYQWSGYYVILDASLI
ncbi:MAG TPA: diphthine--ammonia ligase [Acidilobales archaeon]|nr:diphthine--ammonia ligase [Acidilobales archaeon]